MILNIIFFYFSVLPPIGQTITVGQLSNYFCEKNSLEEELSLLRGANNSELAAHKEEEIRKATRNACFYATRIALIACYTLFIYLCMDLLCCIPDWNDAQDCNDCSNLLKGNE